MNWASISKVEYEGKFLRPNKNYLFAKNSTLAPVCCFELQGAVTALPLVFSSIHDGYVGGVTEFCCVMGLKQDNNLLVGTDGAWNSTYIPADYRCYPFRLGTDSDKRLKVMIDQGTELINEVGDGVPLFNGDGSESEEFKQYIGGLQKVARNRYANQQVCKLLASLDLFQPFKFNYETTDGTFINLENLLSIKVEEFRSLEKDKYEQLRKIGAVDLVYAHFYSMERFNVLIGLMNKREASEQSLKTLGLGIFDEQEEEINFNFE